MVVTTALNSHRHLLDLDPPALPLWIPADSSLDRTSLIATFRLFHRRLRLLDYLVTRLMHPASRQPRTLHHTATRLRNIDLRTAHRTNPTTAQAILPNSTCYMDHSLSHAREASIVAPLREARLEMVVAPMTATAVTALPRTRTLAWLTVLHTVARLAPRRPVQATAIVEV